MAPGAPVEVPAARDIVPNVNRISRALRREGGVNIFLRYTCDPGEPQPWTTRYTEYLSPERREAHTRAFSRGAEDLAIMAGPRVLPADPIVDKTRFSAFVPGTCPLDALLRERDADTLIVTGTLTNVCCESTARDAMQRNFKVIFVADGNAALTDAEHNATLCNMIGLFADVMTADHVVGVIEPGRARGAA